MRLLSNPGDAVAILQQALHSPSPQVTNCTGGILSLAAQQLSLAGQATGNTSYQMYASNSSAQSTNTCNVTLLNSQARCAS